MDGYIFFYMYFRVLCYIVYLFLVSVLFMIRKVCEEGVFFMIEIMYYYLLFLVENVFDGVI